MKRVVAMVAILVGISAGLTSLWHVHSALYDGATDCTPEGVAR